MPGHAIERFANRNLRRLTVAKFDLLRGKVSRPKVRPPPWREPLCETWDLLAAEQAAEAFLDVVHQAAALTDAGTSAHETVEL